MEGQERLLIGETEPDALGSRLQRGDMDLMRRCPCQHDVTLKPGSDFDLWEDLSVEGTRDNSFRGEAIKIAEALLRRPSHLDHLVRVLVTLGRHVPGTC